jgi:zinc D-Ala-D-Ala dipeptidase
MLWNRLKILVFPIVIVWLVILPLSARLVELITINARITLDVRYATTNNFTGKVVYPSARCFLQEPAALALADVQVELERQGLGLKVFDGYRPLSVQKIFWNICPDTRYVANPAKGSKHNRGTAVDLTLVDIKTGQELIMPSGYDDFTEKAHRNYATMSSEARKNCKLLEDIMTKYGFVPMATEWWHFDWNDWKQYPILDVAFNELDKKD